MERKSASLHTAVAGATVLMVAIALTCLSVGQASAASRPYERGENAAAQSDWTPDLDCTQCHKEQAVSLGMATDETPTDEKASNSVEGAASDAAETTEASVDENGTDQEEDTPEEASALDAYAKMHVATLGFTCITCHEDSDDIKAAHVRMETAAVPTKLTKTEVSNEVCLGCHVEEDLAEATADCDVLTDDNGTVVNPHDLPDVGDHENILCVDCHQVHTTDKTLAQTSMTTCSSCHHAGVFECGTCH